MFFSVHEDIAVRELRARPSADLARGRGGDMGGYEWQAAPAYRASVRHGISAVTLDQEGKINHLTTVWDGRPSQTPISRS